MMDCNKDQNLTEAIRERVGTQPNKKATNISVLAAIGVRWDGQKVLLPIMNMGRESKAAWTEFLGDLDAQKLFAIHSHP